MDIKKKLQRQGFRETAVGIWTKRSKAGQTVYVYLDDETDEVLSGQHWIK